MLCELELEEGWEKSKGHKEVKQLGLFTDWEASTSLLTPHCVMIPGHSQTRPSHYVRESILSENEATPPRRRCALGFALDM